MKNIKGSEKKPNTVPKKAGKTAVSAKKEAERGDDEVLRLRIELLKCVATYSLFFIAFFFVIYYIFGPGKVDFHSDCTDTLLWAEAGYDAGKLINPDFAYACLLPFGISLVMQLFIGITGVSYLTHAIGMVAFLILFSAAFIFMLVQAGFKEKEIAVSYFIMIFLMSASLKLREIFWGHTIYYTLGLLFLFTGLGIAFMLKKRCEKVDKKFGVPCCLLVLLTLLSAANGIQAIAIFILPTAAALIGGAWLDFDDKLFCKKNIAIMAAGLAVLVAAVLGMKLGAGLAGDIKTSYAAQYQNFADANSWVGHIDMLLTNWLSLSGVNIEAGDKMMSLKSVINIVRIMLALIIAVIPVYRIFTYEKMKHNETKMFFIVYWANTVFVMLGWIFGLLSTGNWRLVPVLCTGVVYLIMYVRELFEDKRYQRLAVLFIVPCIVCSLAAAAEIAKSDRDFENSKNGRRIALIKKYGCPFGYATFWNANVTSVLSDGDIRVCNISVTDDGLKKYVYQCNKNWYEDTAENNRFLLLERGEFDHLRNAAPELVDKAALIDDTTDPDFVLLVFYGNIDEYIN